MDKPIFSGKLILSLLAVMLVFFVLAQFISKREEQEAETMLSNPIQVQSYEQDIYFLDSKDSGGQTIKKYRDGKVYNAVPWISDSFFEGGSFIAGFDVVSANKFIVLIEKLPERSIRGPQDIPQTWEHSLYMLDGNVKKASKIADLNGTKGFVTGMYGQIHVDVDEEGNMYLPFYKELVKIAPDGKRFVLTSLDMLSQDIVKDAAGFYQSSVSSQRIFTILEKKDSRKVIIEIGKNGKLIKEYDLFEKGFVGFIKFYESALFIRSHHVLYKYDLETGALEKIFDEPLDEIHHYVVVDLAKTDNGYLLLVTNSDTGNYTDVWKLRNDGTLQRDFIETNPDFDE